MRHQLFNRVEAQNTGRIREKVTYFILPARVNFAIGRYCNGFYGRLIGQGIGFPVTAVVGKQPIIVGKIKDTIFILFDIVNFGTGIKVGIGVFFYCRYANGGLRVYGVCKNMANNNKQ